MDMHVRFWNTMENQVCTRYFNAFYMGKAKALYILQQFKTCKNYDFSELFSIGTHGLHVVSGW